jgi:hypothetical protein
MKTSARIVWMLAISAFAMSIQVARAGGDPVNGLLLFNKNCKACHDLSNRDPAKRGANNPSEIQNAIANVSQMSSLSSLTLADLTDIAAYLATQYPAATANYQGIWWAAPANSESGWGLNVAHQGDTIFASWFTYDPKGRGWWLVMTAQKIGTNQYQGQLFETIGPSFDAVPFDPNLVKSNPVGTGTLTFSDASTGTFAYTVSKGGDVSQSRAITRQVFGPLPVCTFGAQPDLSLATNYQDIWWRSPAGSESGWGINLNHQGDTIFATWFTYDHDGTPLWLVVTAKKIGTNVYKGDLFRTTGPPFNAMPFDPNLVKADMVGTATFTFADGNNATFAYDITGVGPARVTQSKAITREVFTAPGTTCN